MNVSSAIWHLDGALARVEAALEDNGGELTPEIEATLNSCELTKEQIADNLRILLTQNDHRSAAIAAEIKRLQELKKASTNAAESLKKYLLAFMQRHGITAIETDLCKVSYNAGRESVSVIDEEALVGAAIKKLSEMELPAWLNVEVKIDKTALGKMLKEDGGLVPTKDGVPAAELVRTPYITIR